MAADLRRGHPDGIVRGRDVANVLAGASVARSGNALATQQLLQALEGLQPAGEVWYRIYRHNNDPDGRIERIFWTYNWCVDMWKRNPELLSIDNTCKVNRFNMPLCLVSGVTPLHTSFLIAWCLLSGKKAESFALVLTQLQACAKEHGAICQYDRDTDMNAPVWVHEPHVILSDFDKAFKRAARAAYPSIVKHQLCVWHILKNVAHNIKDKWVGSLEGTAFNDRGGGTGSAGATRDSALPSENHDDPERTQDSVAAAGTFIQHPDENVYDPQAGLLAYYMLQEGDRVNRRSGARQ